MRLPLPSDALAALRRGLETAAGEVGADEDLRDIDAGEAGGVEHAHGDGALRVDRG
mgnify:CR=1 FL=1